MTSPRQPDPAPDPVVLRGRVLRAWREHAGVSAAALARALPVQRSTVSMWEADGRAKRGTTAQTVRDIARWLGLTGPQAAAMLDLWRAAGSVADGLPQRAWSMNFDGPSGPAWAWLRPETIGATGGRIRAALWWGEPFRTSVDLDASTGGVLIGLPTTLANPALEVRLEQPGWVDFGRGIIPAAVTDRLGIEVVDGAALLQSSSEVTDPAPAGVPMPSAYTQVIRRTFEDLGIGWRVLRPHGWVLAPHVRTAEAAELTDGAQSPDRSHRARHGEHRCGPGDLAALASECQARLLISGRQLYRIRQARGYSRQTLADQATRLDPANHLSAKAIEALETTGRIVGITGLVARIDVVLGLDGRLGVERTFDSRAAAVEPSAARPPSETRGSGSTNKVGRPAAAPECLPRSLVEFPRYWIGPVWLQAIGPAGDGEGVVDLRWGPWRRRQRVASGEVLDFRRAPTACTPLAVTVPHGWRITAGLGAWPGARDINRDWWPADLWSAVGLLRDALGEIRAGQQRARRQAD